MERQSIITSRPVIAVLAAITGAIGGAQLDSPPASRLDPVDFYVHTMRISKSAQDASYSLSVYSTGVFTRTDGGSVRRDFGERACTPDARRLSRVANSLLDECYEDDDGGRSRVPAGTWAHVVEIRGGGAADGGSKVELYLSRTTTQRDGGTAVADLGLTQCDSVAAGIIEVVSTEALRCAEGALDEP